MQEKGTHRGETKWRESENEIRTQQSNDDFMEKKERKSKENGIKKEHCKSFQRICGARKTHIHTHNR